MGLNVVKKSHVYVHIRGKEGLDKMLSDLRQITEECEEREFKFTQDRREVALACNLPIMIRVILVFAVNLSFG
jgi:hypothetical protein